MLEIRDRTTTAAVHWSKRPKGFSKGQPNPTPLYTSNFPIRLYILTSHQTKQSIVPLQLQNHQPILQIKKYELEKRPNNRRWLLGHRVLSSVLCFRGGFRGEVSKSLTFTLSSRRARDSVYFELSPSRVLQGLQHLNGKRQRSLQSLPRVRTGRHAFGRSSKARRVTNRVYDEVLHEADTIRDGVSAC